MADEKRTLSPMDRVWDFFISVKLAIITLIVLASTSILGTIIEQNQPPEKYHQIYEDWAFALMDRMNLFDMYHSKWFLLMLVLFTVNLTCCTIDRFPKMLKVVRNPRTKLDGSLEKSLSLLDRWKRKGTLPEWAGKYTEALSGSFAKPTVTEDGGEVHLYAETGVASRFGVYVTHLSIVIIFIGAIVGNVAGFKGYVNIPEGESITQVPVRGGIQMQDLGFTVRCNAFSLETYPSGQPKAYKSDLSIIDGGREVLRKTIVVNDPLQYKGIWFYQSSYGQAGGRDGPGGGDPQGRDPGENARPHGQRAGSDRRLRDRARGELRAELPGERPGPPGGRGEARAAARHVLARPGTPRPRPATRRFPGLVLPRAELEDVHRAPGRQGPRGEHRLAGMHPDGDRAHHGVLPLSPARLGPACAGDGRPCRGRPRRVRQPQSACLREEIRETTDRREGGGAMTARPRTAAGAPSK